MKQVVARGQDYLVTNVDGTYWALNDRCPHDCGVSLASGTLDGKVVTCPKHHAQFDVTTGLVVGKAKTLLFHMTPPPVRTYRVQVEEDEIVVELP
jgi:3-phenylpropionate/trans-cinnamate dioxygenase ferredoxin subunit